MRLPHRGPAAALDRPGVRDHGRQEAGNPDPPLRRSPVPPGGDPAAADHGLVGNAALFLISSFLV
ncbi:MAG: hypothetical protein ACJ72M_12540 [Propionibacteriaceae bacterium]